TLLRRVRATWLEAEAHRDLPFERLVEELQLARDPSRTPLFQTSFALQDAGVRQLALPGVSAAPIDIDSGTAWFDLALLIEQRESELIGVLEYSTDVFDDTTIARMAGHFQTLLAGIVADEAQFLSHLPLLTTAQRRQLLIEWNDSAAGVRGQG